MATLLYRIGRFAYRHALLVLLAWVVAAAGVLGLGLGLGGDSEESFSIPGTESQQAIDRLAGVFPQTAGASAQVVIQAPEGETIDEGANEEAVEETAEALGDLEGIAQAVPPSSEYANDPVSDDHRTAIITLQFDEEAMKVTDQLLEDVQAAADPARDAGLKVAFGGQVFQDVAYGVTPTELIGVGFAALVLIIVFGSFVAAGLPLATAFASLMIALGGVLAVSAFTEISAATPMLALMIGLAVGIDYALFILSRHRTQLGQGMDPEESTATAVATSGSAVVFAGLTVVIALAGLLVVGVPFLGVMGVAAAVAVVLAMLAAVTMLPAILGLIKGRLAPKPGSRAARRATADPERAGGLGGRWVRLVLRAPVVFIVAVVAVLGTLSIPAFSLALALPDGASEPETSTARQAYDMIDEAFGPGRNGALVVALDITQSTDPIADLKAIGERLEEIPGVVSAGGGVPNPTVDTGIIQVEAETGPTDPATTALVERIREAAPDIEDDFGTEMWVTGNTAVQIDVSSRLNSALVPFGLIVVGLSIVLLAAVFRSLLVPLSAAIGFLLSLMAAFGVVVAVFQWGWGAEALHAVPGPILSFMPILLIAILFGLAMDYQVFIVSGMREAWIHGERTKEGARRAVISGFTGAARVVTAAAAIMFFVFAAFVPEGAGVIKTIALGLAVGIAADAFLVRMTLIPAIMALAGRHAWYLPRWLGRVLPHLDVEGEGLVAHRREVEWAERTDAAIALEGLVAGGADGRRVGPITAAVPRGALALVAGPEADRRALALTISGRLAPVDGLAQVDGVSVGTDAARAARRVALADLGASREEVAVTAAGLVAERLRLTLPVRRAHRSRELALDVLDAVDEALDSGVSDAAARAGATIPAGRRRGIRPEAPLAGLPPLERAAVLAAAALAEGAPVALLDARGLEPDVLVRLAPVLEALAAPGATVALGVDRIPAALAPPSGARTRTVIELHREGVQL
ncbi:MMPL family transporter [Homoserinibacter sp. YIM 151385]|uniref:MMPL family transporter n=1 Tax=Homoserinibacter sp. YIM 151385 TaxID=2985506 RepID=UPI0022F010A4|nr:MMPL family transporter [Homoserinibacter sp. YIM 151385]WBU39295.1 MMPL family transporter [Homoserinibacter sp. YIM 151385]